MKRNKETRIEQLSKMVQAGHWDVMTPLGENSPTVQVTPHEGGYKLVFDGWLRPTHKAFNATAGEKPPQHVTAFRKAAADFASGKKDQEEFEKALEQFLQQERAKHFRGSSANVRYTEPYSEKNRNPKTARIRLILEHIISSSARDEFNRNWKKLSDTLQEVGISANRG